MKVLSALAVKEVVEPASQEFSAETGESFDSFYGPVGTLTGKIAAGETADLLIAIPPVLEKLAKEGVVTGRYDLGMVGIWVTIRPGLKAPAPARAASDLDETWRSPKQPVQSR